MCSGTEAGSYLRLIDSCITQLKAQGPSRTCNESKEEEEGYLAWEENESAAVLEGHELEDGEGDEEQNIRREEHRLVLRDALPQAAREEHDVHHYAQARPGQPQRNLRGQLPSPSPTSNARVALGSLGPV